jgi:hypothetical protein
VFLVPARESPDQEFCGECGGQLASALGIERSDAIAYQAAETIPSEAVEEAHQMSDHHGLSRRHVLGMAIVASGFAWSGAVAGEDRRPDCPAW